MLECAVIEEFNVSDETARDRENRQATPYVAPEALGLDPTSYSKFAAQADDPAYVQSPDGQWFKITSDGQKVKIDAPPGS